VDRIDDGTLSFCAHQIKDSFQQATCGPKQLTFFDPRRPYAPSPHTIIFLVWTFPPTPCNLAQHSIAMKNDLFVDDLPDLPIRRKFRSQTSENMDR
jgi:hypothetical protein